MTTSTIDIAQPSYKSALDTAPVRNNFAAAASDINALWAQLESPVGFACTVPIPSAISSVYNFEGAEFTLNDTSSYVATASCSLTPEQIFDAYSTARSAPAVTYYVNPSGASGTWSVGNDTNNGLSRAAPYLTLSKAITSINAGAVPAKVYVRNGNCVRSSSFGSTAPTQDVAWIADGGRVIVGTYDAFSAPSLDGTYTNTYSWARSNVNRVMDISRQDEFGQYVELPLVGSAAICNRTPNSWYTDNVTLYVNRLDGAAVTNANTRYYLATVGAVFTGSGLNSQYFGCEDNGLSGFDMEGGSNGINLTSVSPSVSENVIVARNSTMRYAGGRVDTGSRGVTLESFNGAGWFFNCDASHNVTDGFNCHNFYSATVARMVTVNCSGFNNGASPTVGVATSASANGWTTHENVIGADFAGRYENNRGGTCRSVNTSKSLLAGTYVKNDLGDVVNAISGVYPTAYMTDNTAVYYCFRTKADMQGGQYAYVANSGTSINLRDAWPSRAASCGAGTFGTW